MTRNFDPSPSQPGEPPAELPGRLEPLSVEMLNEVDASRRQARMDRLEAESRGWDNVFGQ